MSSGNVCGGNKYIQACNVIILITGFCELIIGAKIAAVVQGVGGVWWVGVVSVITGFIGLMQGNGCVRGTAYCLR